MTTQYRPSSHSINEAAQSLAPEANPEASQDRQASVPLTRSQSSPTPIDQLPSALLETSPTPHGQVPPEQLPSSPIPVNQTCPDANPTLNLPNPGPDANYDYIHHILIGSPQGVTDAINRLHLGHRIERHRWTPLIAVRESGIHITPAQGQVISYLIQQRPKA